MDRISYWYVRLDIPYNPFRVNLCIGRGLSLDVNIILQQMYAMLISSNPLFEVGPLFHCSCFFTAFLGEIGKPSVVNLYEMAPILQ